MSTAKEQTTEKIKKKTSTEGEGEELDIGRAPQRDHGDLQQAAIHKSANGMAALQASEGEETITQLAELQTVGATLEVNEVVRVVW